LHGIIFNFPLKLVIIVLCFDVCYYLSAEAEIATCFWLELGLYFLCMLRVRGFVAVWNIGFYTTVLLLNLVIMAYTIASDFRNVGVHL
jgi:uncharacterized membrane protein